MLGLNLLSLLLVLPLGYTTRIVPSFTPTGIRQFTNGTNFTNILLKDDSVFVGANLMLNNTYIAFERNKILKLDAVDIEDTNSRRYVNYDLPANNEQIEQCMMTYYDEKLCNNYVRTILNRESQKDLYVCGTYAFMPRIFQFSYDLSLVKEDDGYGYCSLNPVDSSTAVWIEKGNPMEIGSLYSGSLLDASTKTQPVEPVIYRPELRRGDKSFQYLRTPKFDSDWLNQPKFLASFDVDDHVLFFMREKSIEQVAEGQDVAYGRVLRVCKNDMGALDLGNQWSSMRKTRLTCIYNKMHLDNLESVRRVSEDLFVGLFTVQLPNDQSASFLCEFTKEQILSHLNGPAFNFKELVPGTQYWSKLSAEKTPADYPSTCNYNSHEVRDEISNFAKTHCLYGDHLAGKLVNFVNAHVTSVAVDTITTPKELRTNLLSDEINVYYLGTEDGRVIKMSSLDSSLVISEWTLDTDAKITELSVRSKQSLFVATDSFLKQIALNQCEQYDVCSTCMRDPYCGWNIRSHACEFVDASSNLVALNENLCSRFQSQTTLKSMMVETASAVRLDANIMSKYLLEAVVWKKDDSPVVFNENIFLTESKDLVILNGNLSQSGTYKCYVNVDLIVSYNLSYKPASAHTSESSSVAGQKCITAESYIKQYNNWCEEYSRYQRALNEWEDLKDKSCSSMAGQGPIELN